MLMDYRRKFCLAPKALVKSVHNTTRTKINSRFALKALSLFLFTSLIVHSETRATYAANPKHLEQLRTTNACPGCDLTDAPLEGINLHSSNLRGANLNGAQLRGANLTEANLHAAQLRGVQLGGADLRKAVRIVG
jgi:uncharacterized protein YjbI with pentapeptide repeats